MSAPESPRKMTPTERLHDIVTTALTQRAAMRPSVTISRDAAGGYSYDVRVAHDDPQEAWKQALALEALAAKKYPPVVVAPRDKASFTRNAKGETQMDFEAQGEDAYARVEAMYQAGTARYPTANGTVTNDAPAEKDADEKRARAAAAIARNQAKR